MQAGDFISRDGDRCRSSSDRCPRKSMRWRACWPIRESGVRGQGSVASGRSQQPELALSCNDKTSLPPLDVFRFEESCDTMDQRLAAWRTETHQQNTAMSPGGEPTGVREVHVLSDDEPRLPLGTAPYVVVGMSGETFLTRSVDVMPDFAQSARKTEGKVFVQLNP